MFQAALSFLDPGEGSPASPGTAHYSPSGETLGTTKASCQPGRSAPGAGREDHEQQIEVFNPPALHPVGLIPAGLVTPNPSLPRESAPGRCGAMPNNCTLPYINLMTWRRQQQEPYEGDG